jgi:hypothetical protein
MPAITNGIPIIIALKGMPINARRAPLIMKPHPELGRPYVLGKAAA